MSGFERIFAAEIERAFAPFREELRRSTDKLRAALMADVRRSFAPRTRDEAVETFYVAPIELHIPEEGDSAYN